MIVRVVLRLGANQKFMIMVMNRLEELIVVFVYLLDELEAKRAVGFL